MPDNYGGNQTLHKKVLDKEKFVSNWDLIFKPKTTETNDQQTPIPTSTVDNTEDLQ